LERDVVSEAIELVDEAAGVAFELARVGHDCPQARRTTEGGHRHLVRRCEPAGHDPKIRDVKKTASASPRKPADPVRAARMRHDAQRAMSTNLAEGIALSHKLLRFTGAARSR
jgi:hypothetical protein